LPASLKERERLDQLECEFKAASGKIYREGLKVQVEVALKCSLFFNGGFALPGLASLPVGGRA